MKENEWPELLARLHAIADEQLKADLSDAMKEVDVLMLPLPGKVREARSVIAEAMEKYWKPVYRERELAQFRNKMSEYYAVEWRDADVT